MKTSINHSTGTKLSEMLTEDRLRAKNMIFVPFYVIREILLMLLIFSNFGEVFDLLFILILFVSARE